MTPYEAAEKLKDSDRVRVTFGREVSFRDADNLWRGTEAVGSVMAIAQMRFIGLEDTRNWMGLMSHLQVPLEDVVDIEVLETLEEREKRLHQKAQGDLVFERAPQSAAELREQLETIASMIPGSERKRSRELLAQFHSKADIVNLAKTKRTYILKKEELGRAEDFNPWQWPDDRVYRNETVLAIPADFELDRADRICRTTRFDQTVRILGQSEADTRTLAIQLRKDGWKVRREHPNGFCLIVGLGLAKKLEVRLLLSSNGYWNIQPRNWGGKSYMKSFNSSASKQKCRALLDSANRKHLT